MKNYLKVILVSSIIFCTNASAGVPAPGVELPEPASIVLMSLGLLGLVYFKKKR